MHHSLEWTTHPKRIWWKEVYLDWVIRIFCVWSPWSWLGVGIVDAKSAEVCSCFYELQNLTVHCLLLLDVFVFQGCPTLEKLALLTFFQQCSGWKLNSTLPVTMLILFKASLTWSPHQNRHLSIRLQHIQRLLIASRSSWSARLWLLEHRPRTWYVFFINRIKSNHLHRFSLRFIALTDIPLDNTTDRFDLQRDHSRKSNRSVQSTTASAISRWCPSTIEKNSEHLHWPRPSPTKSCTEFVRLQQSKDKRKKKNRDQRNPNRDHFIAALTSLAHIYHSTDRVGFCLKGSIGDIDFDNVSFTCPARSDHPVRCHPSLSLPTASFP